jgi:hypothetical protein
MESETMVLNTTSPAAQVGRHLVDYDPALRRVWIGGQRLHHGATGAAVALAGLAGLAIHRLPLKDGLPVALVGTALMAHDWKDRTVWFRRGPQFED